MVRVPMVPPGRRRPWSVNIEIYQTKNDRFLGQSPRNQRKLKELEFGRSPFSNLLIRIQRLTATSNL
jgi:hypothetical protein